MQVLITGSRGFLGSYIKNSLKLLYKELNSKKGDYDYVCDLKNEIPVFKEKFSLVIHAAGMAHINFNSIIDSNNLFNVNVQGTKNLLIGLENQKIPKRFVFISSVAVYGLEKGLNYNEDNPLLAIDPYGLSKIQAERIVLKWCQENNVICTILRLPLLVGDNPPGNLGAMIKGVQKGYYFNIAGGQARKSMVLANDVAKILIKASEIGGIYNLTDGYHPSFYELSNAIGKQYGKSRIFNLPFFIAKTIALVGDFIGAKFPIDSNKLKKITSDLTFDDTKARKVLGWNPSNVLDYYKK